MPWKQGKAAPEGNGPVLHHGQFGSDQPTLVDLYRIVKEQFDRSDKQFNVLTEKMRVTNQRLAGLEHEARQSRLGTEAGVEPDAKTRKRTEGASAVDRGKNGHSSSAGVDGGLTNLTHFGIIIAEPSTSEKSIGDALVDKGAKAPKPCISHVEMRTPTTASG